MIKMEIRDFCIRFAKCLDKSKKIKENLMYLLRKLNELNILFGKNTSDVNLSAEVKSVKLELKKLSEHKSKGAITLSRVRWYEHGERNNKDFINFEKRAYNRKHIVKLKMGENQCLEEQNKIFSEMNTSVKYCIPHNCLKSKCLTNPVKHF